MPTSSASTEPSQNQSTMRLAARPATRWRDSCGTVEKGAVFKGVGEVALFFEAAQNGADGGVLERPVEFFADLLRGDRCPGARRWRECYVRVRRVPRDRALSECYSS